VVLRTSRAVAALALLVPLAAGCGSGSASTGAAPGVTVSLAGKDVQLRPTQYCSGGALRRYTVTPPIIAAPPGTRVTLQVPGAVAEQGWSVQVFDEKLQTQIGTVDVGTGTATFDRITTSDVVPPAFYLVVSEHGGEACQGLAGAWPVGIIRAGG
jgi:hypothetical protein